MWRSISRERSTMNAMIRIYCTSLHQPEKLCEECTRLMIYAQKRIEKCRFGNEKPTCKDCPVHCYSPKMREKIQEVMRFSGPKMIYKQPVMAILHILS